MEPPMNADEESRTVRLQDNQVRLQLFAMACNLGNYLRRLALPRPVKPWPLTTLREKRIKIGAKVVHHARYVAFQMAEVAAPRKLFRTQFREWAAGKAAMNRRTPKG